MGRHARRIPHRKLTRRRRRLLKGVGFTVVGIGLLGTVAFATHLTFWTIDEVSVHGTQVIDANAVRRQVRGHLDGRYAWLFSRRNALLYPQDTIRRELRSSFPRIRRVRVFTRGLTSLTVRVTERSPYVRWCPRSTSASESCVFLDKTGQVFATAPDASGDVYITMRPASEAQAVAGTSTATRNASTSTSVQPSIGERYKPDTFPGLVDTIERLTALDLSVTQIYSMTRGDYRLVLENGGTLLINARRPVEDTVRNLRLMLTHEDLGLVAGTSSNTFRSIDLRFGDRVFYTPATSTSVQP